MTKKLFIIVLLAGVFSFFFFGCSGGGSEDSGNDEVIDIDTPEIDFCPWISGDVKYILSGFSEEEEEMLRGWLEEAWNLLMIQTGEDTYTRPVYFEEIMPYDEWMAIEKEIERLRQLRESIQQQQMALSYQINALSAEIYRLHSIGQHEMAEILETKRDSLREKADELQKESMAAEANILELQGQIHGTITDPDEDTLTIQRGDENEGPLGYAPAEYLYIKDIDKATFGRLIFNLLGFEGYEGGGDEIFSAGDIARIREVYDDYSVWYPELWECHNS